MPACKEKILNSGSKTLRRCINELMDCIMQGEKHEKGENVGTDNETVNETMVDKMRQKYIEETILRIPHD